MTDYVRLLFCHDCQSVDQLPDYAGPVDHDYTLAHRVGQHQFPNGEPHRGIMGKAEDTPTSISAAIDQMASMVKPGAGTGLGQPMYDLRDNYKAESMACWKKHNRTSDCGDYRADKMRLWADTKADRKAEGLATNREERPNAWLCDFCVVHSLVQQKQAQAQGLDK
jgi:hypothetical protein